jgi:hypothetical protein
MAKHPAERASLALCHAATLALLFVVAGCARSHRLEPDAPRPDAGAGCGTCARVVACSPGASVFIGCTSRIGRRCSGDPTLTICDASRLPDPEACSAASDRLAFVDDADGLCPETTVICPRSGRLAIDSEPFGSAGTFFCDFAVR